MILSLSNRQCRGEHDNGVADKEMPHFLSNKDNNWHVCVLMHRQGLAHKSNQASKCSALWRPMIQATMMVAFKGDIITLRRRGFFRVLYCSACEHTTVNQMPGWAAVCEAQDLNHEYKLLHGKTMSLRSELSNHSLGSQNDREGTYTWIWRCCSFLFSSVSGAHFVLINVNDNCRLNEEKAAAGKHVQVLFCSCFINRQLDFYCRRSFRGNSGGHFLWDVTSSNNNTGVERCLWLCPVLFHSLSTLQPILYISFLCDSLVDPLLFLHLPFLEFLSFTSKTKDIGFFWVSLF